LANIRTVPQSYDRLCVGAERIAVVSSQTKVCHLEDALARE
jgi:hypothetical protein